MAGQAFFSSSSGITTPVLASKEEAESGAHRNFQEVEKSSFGGQGGVKWQIPAGERQQNYSTGREPQARQLKINPPEFYGEK